MTRGKILIAGAGIGGLTAASCLLKQGWDVEVYEQASVLREIGAGIQLSANAMHVLRALGLEQRIRELGVRPRAYVFACTTRARSSRRSRCPMRMRRRMARPTCSSIAPISSICWLPRRAR